MSYIFLTFLLNTLRTSTQYERLRRRADGVGRGVAARAEPARDAPRRLARAPVPKASTATAVRHITYHS